MEEQCCCGYCNRLNQGNDFWIWFCQQSREKYWKVKRIKNYDFASRHTLIFISTPHKEFHPQNIFYRFCATSTYCYSFRALFLFSIFHSSPFLLFSLYFHPKYNKFVSFVVIVMLNSQFFMFSFIYIFLPLKEMEMKVLYVIMLS